MKWAPGDRSNVDDERGRSGGGRAVPIGIGGLVVIALLSWATGTDFLSLLNNGGGPSATTAADGTPATTPAEEKRVDFVDAVANAKELQALQPPAIKCPECSADMAFNDFPERYFSFLTNT